MLALQGLPFGVLVLGAGCVLRIFGALGQKSKELSDGVLDSAKTTRRRACRSALVMPSFDDDMGRASGMAWFVTLLVLTSTY